MGLLEVVPLVTSVVINKRCVNTSLPDSSSNSPHLLGSFQGLLMKICNILCADDCLVGAIYCHMGVNFYYQVKSEIIVTIMTLLKYISFNFNVKKL